jgi:hypothetical protein
MIFANDSEMVDYSTFQLKQGGGNFKFTRKWCYELPTVTNR